MTKMVLESAKVVSERINGRMGEVATLANAQIIKDPTVPLEEKLPYLKSMIFS